MDTRHKLEWHFKQIDHQIELNFENNFNFALVSHLIKVSLPLFSIISMYMHINLVARTLCYITGIQTC